MITTRTGCAPDVIEDGSSGYIVDIDDVEALADPFIKLLSVFFFFNDTATTEIYTLSYTLSLHDALPISSHIQKSRMPSSACDWRSEEHTSELSRMPSSA